MRVMLFLAVTMAVALVGCGKKKPPPVSAENSGSGNGGIIPAGGVGVVVNPGEALSGGGGGGGSSTPPPRVSSVGGPVAPNQNGNLTVTGGQGAIQAPRMAAARTINNAQLKDLHLSMFQTWSLDNRVPSADEVMKEAQQNPQLYPLIKEEVIILTGTSRGDGVWAYSQYPQRMGDHYVITQQGVAQMAPEELRKRLEQQKSPVKLGK
ncbi:MAG: hypothetical protein JWO38_728 [Gemmataceae bacterium]|nr:hypothetical protein [Gemmataceae bacterium]